jgi:hypothetical protein
MSAMRPVRHPGIGSSAPQQGAARRILVVAAAAAVTLLTAPAWAAPVAINVTPASVVAGGTVHLSGSVGPTCPGPVTLISAAFVHTHDFAGQPALFVPVKPGGAFSTTTRIPSTRMPGTYRITGRCGGGNLGVSATLRVRGPVSQPSRLPFTGTSALPTAGVGLGLVGVGVLLVLAARRDRPAHR